MKRLPEILVTILLAVSLWYITSNQVVAIPSKDAPALLYSTDLDDHLGTVFKDAISNAKESVQVLIYTLSDQRVIQALRQKAADGIKVTVICDDAACQGIERKLGNDIRLIKSTPKGLMHLKILIIDETLVWIGSANLTGESLRLHGNLVAGFDSPEMAKWIFQKVAYLANGESAYIPQQAFQIGDQIVELWFLPDREGAVQRIRGLIRGAKKSIKVAMFTWTRLDFANDIVSAKIRGIDVQIVLDSNSSKGASLGVVKALQNGQVPFRINTSRGLLHYKTMIIDDTILVNGSANWTKAAFTQNEDCFIVLNPLNSEQKGLLKDMWKTILKNSK